MSGKEISQIPHLVVIIMHRLRNNSSTHNIQLAEVVYCSFQIHVYVIHRKVSAHAHVTEYSIHTRLHTLPCTQVVTFQCSTCGAQKNVALKLK